jgi:hypothetical protein
VDQSDIEGLADALYRAAGLDGDEPSDLRQLATAMLGACDFVRGGRRPALFRSGGVWVVTVPARLAGPTLRWALAHELCEHALEARGYVAEDREDVAQALTAAVLAPRRWARAVAREVGPRWEELAEALGMEPGAAALRWSEVTGWPLALVEARRVYVRGRDWAWPSPRELSDLARRIGERIDRRRAVVIGE